MKNRSRHNIVISAYGCVTPLGGTESEIATALKNGISGIRPILKFDCSSFKVGHAGVPPEGNDYIQWPSEKRKMTGELFYTDIALKRLMGHPGFPEGVYDPARIGCFMGIDESIFDIQLAFDLIATSMQGDSTGFDLVRAIEKNVRLVDSLNCDPASILQRINKKIGFSGPALCHIGLCAASLQAIGLGYKALCDDRVDSVISGGVSAKITPEQWAGLELADVISTNIDIAPECRSRPFDVWRSGYVPAEGAIFFILEREATVKASGRKPLLEILGYGSSLNAFHIVKPDVQSTEMKLAMTRALDDADFSPEDVDLVNAHGTSTILNDFQESKAICDVFVHNDVKVTANKSLHGHLTAAAGAMEILDTIISSQGSFIPGTINVEKQDSRCRINLIKKTEEANPKIILKNSFGMGGLAASLVVRNVN